MKCVGFSQGILDVGNRSGSRDLGAPKKVNDGGVLGSRSEAKADGMGQGPVG